MAWPAEMDLPHRDKLKKACMGFATGVSLYSLAGILQSGALLSNETLEKQHPEMFGTAIKKSQWHDQKKSPGYSCVYFRGVRRRPCSGINNYLPRIVNSLVSVGSNQGLVFYVDFDTAYEKLVYGFSNSTDMKGNGGKGSPNDQVATFVSAFTTNTDLDTGKNKGSSEITFKDRVPLSCVSFIGVNFEKGRTRPTYFHDKIWEDWKRYLKESALETQQGEQVVGQKKTWRTLWTERIALLLTSQTSHKSLTVQFTMLNDMVQDCHQNRWLFFQNNSFVTGDLVKRSSLQACGSSQSAPSDRSQPSAPSSSIAGGEN